MLEAKETPTVARIAALLAVKARVWHDGDWHDGDSLEGFGTCVICVQWSVAPNAPMPELGRVSDAPWCRTALPITTGLRSVTPEGKETPTVARIAALLAVIARVWHHGESLRLRGDPNCTGHWVRYPGPTGQTCTDVMTTCLPCTKTYCIIHCIDRTLVVEESSKADLALVCAHCIVEIEARRSPLWILIACTL